MGLVIKLPNVLATSATINLWLTGVTRISSAKNCVLTFFVRKFFYSNSAYVLSFLMIEGGCHFQYQLS